MLCNWKKTEIVKATVCPATYMYRWKFLSQFMGTSSKSLAAVKAYLRDETRGRVTKGYAPSMKNPLLCWEVPIRSL